MKCRDCGKDGFKTPADVKRHKDTDCPVYHRQAAAVEEAVTAPSQESASLEAIERMAAELGVGVVIVKSDRFMVIPRRFLPDEVKYLGNGAYMGIKVRGFLDEDGLVVQEEPEMWR